MGYLVNSPAVAEVNYMISGKNIIENTFHFTRSSGGACEVLYV